MTLATFYKKLGETKNKLRWKKYDWLIRANDAFCPLTAVHYLEKGDRLLLGEYFTASEALGITDDEATQIIRAADNEECDLSGRELKIRKSIEKVLFSGKKKTKTKRRQK